ncbi:hypothetical protein OSTOST_15806 [Ostertagia ostertagi]
MKRALFSSLFSRYAIKLSTKLEKTADRIKEVFDSNMAAFKKRISGLKDKILKKLTLTKEQRAELLERLKLFKRKSVDKVQPMGDSIEEVNMNSHIADALFQGDMVLSKEQEDQLVDDINDDGTRPKRQAMRDPRYPGKRWHEGVNYFFDDNASPIVKSVFKKATELWKADTCIDFKEDKNAKDRVRVWVGTGCWSSVGRVGGMQNISLGQGCESVSLSLSDAFAKTGKVSEHTVRCSDRSLSKLVPNLQLS